MSVVFTFLAEEDIDIANEELFFQFGRRTVELFERRVNETLARLVQFPLSVAPCDPPYPQFPGLRIASVAKFRGRLVYYIPTSDGIRVVRVLPSGTDLDVVFGS